MNDYRIKLKAMRNEEITHKQEICRQKMLENNSSTDGNGELPLVRVRRNDYLGVNTTQKLREVGATNYIMSKSIKGREQLR